MFSPFFLLFFDFVTFSPSFLFFYLRFFSFSCIFLKVLYIRAGPALHQLFGRSRHPTPNQSFRVYQVNLATLKVATNVEERSSEFKGTTRWRQWVRASRLRLVPCVRWGIEWRRRTNRDFASGKNLEQMHAWKVEQEKWTQHWRHDERNLEAAVEKTLCSHSCSSLSHHHHHHFLPLPPPLTLLPPPPPLPFTLPKPSKQPTTTSPRPLKCVCVCLSVPFSSPQPSKSQFWFKNPCFHKNWPTFYWILVESKTFSYMSPHLVSKTDDFTKLTEFYSIFVKNSTFSYISPIFAKKKNN